MTGTTGIDANLLLEGGAPSPQQAILSVAEAELSPVFAKHKIACCGDGAPPSSTTFAQITDQPHSSLLRLLQARIRISKVRFFGCNYPWIG
jgi:hypothetical protein